MNETTVTKGERYYVVTHKGIVRAQTITVQGCADWLWAMNMSARWMIYNENNERTT